MQTLSRCLSMALLIGQTGSFWLPEFKRGLTTPWKQAIPEDHSGSHVKCGISISRISPPAIIITKIGEGHWELSGPCQQQLKRLMNKGGPQKQTNNRRMQIMSARDATCREVLESFPIPDTASAEEAVEIVCGNGSKPPSMINPKFDYHHSLRRKIGSAVNNPKHNVESEPTSSYRQGMLHKMRKTGSSEWENSVVSLAPNLCGLSDGKASELAAAIYRLPTGGWTFAFRCGASHNETARVYYFSAPDNSNVECVTMLRRQSGEFPVAKMTSLMCARRHQIPPRFVLEEPPTPLVNAMSTDKSEKSGDEAQAAADESEQEPTTEEELGEKSENNSTTVDMESNGSGWSNSEDSIVSFAPNLCGLSDGKSSRPVVAIYHSPEGSWVVAFRCDDAQGKSE
ncbi:hypothetical protein Pmar_PMAR018473 [Perkinsus marinus ATCC 50983]|uniref:Uncharacterized protein n=1 Tax=Perkinsus marinus (strain ATCC 50983 / TXsc) TaxID=423536 RepID=C5KZX4_PERM5|nr:hypothetical protein Pmar_PMAR018473 [Perkinsus marinus ATCC 50983]EER09832.1 hypothetical protein Pmar_PMAR018473 [Perkinsus marinus ATCC 50983]|eukprot:XP_002778037.1 hypothetical protein Pmar_PMAR018473 [Perkinsus marinus ATCC 50983]